MSRQTPYPTRAGLLAFLLTPLALGLLLAVIAGRCVSRAEPTTFPRAVILRAIRMVESSGRVNVPDGDGGRAIGSYQIHRVYWLDAVAFDGSLGGDYQDCRQRPYAERVIAAYMRKWASRAWAMGHAETIARVHNGGPEGARKSATDAYWAKVRRHLMGNR